MSAEREPTDRELLAMAYADGELSEEKRRAFETDMQKDGALARLVAEHQTLLVLTRQVAPTEPIESEWTRLQKDPILRGVQSTGTLLLGLGSLGLAGYGIFAVWSATWNPLLKVFCLALITGLVLLFLMMVHARLSTLPYDPYRSVKR